ncbi:MAG: hypothetical protein AAF950_12610 [Pseudomonadota bacterium]
MIRTSLTVAVAGLAIASLANAQTANKSEAQERDEQPVLAVDDPEKGEIEVSLAEGAAEAEIVSPEEMVAEAEVSVAMEKDMTGDMAAMPDIAEDPEW